jgi:hypothetical protein
MMSPALVLHDNEFYFIYGNFISGIAHKLNNHLLSGYRQNHFFAAQINDDKYQIVYSFFHTIKLCFHAT